MFDVLGKWKHGMLEWSWMVMDSVTSQLGAFKGQTAESAESKLDASWAPGANMVLLGCLKCLEQSHRRLQYSSLWFNNTCFPISYIFLHALYIYLHRCPAAKHHFSVEQIYAAVVSWWCPSADSENFNLPLRNENRLEITVATKKGGIAARFHNKIPGNKGANAMAMHPSFPVHHLISLFCTSQCPLNPTQLQMGPFILTSGGTMGSCPHEIARTLHRTGERYDCLNLVQN